jgi:hypothetical protein
LGLLLTIGDRGVNGNQFINQIPILLNAENEPIPLNPSAESPIGHQQQQPIDLGPAGFSVPQIDRQYRRSRIGQNRQALGSGHAEGRAAWVGIDLPGVRGG